MAKWFAIVIRYTSQIPTLNILPIMRVQFKSESGIIIDAFKISNKIVPATETSMIYFPTKNKDAFYSFWITTDYIRFVALDKISPKKEIFIDENLNIKLYKLSDREYYTIRKTFFQKVLSLIKRKKKVGTAIILKDIHDKIILEFHPIFEDEKNYYFDIFSVEKDIADRYILASEKYGLKHKYLVVYYTYAEQEISQKEKIPPKPILSFIDFYNIDFGEEFRRRMVEANRFDREFIYENLVDISTEFKEKIRLQAETEAEIVKMFKLESWWEKYGAKLLTIIMIVIAMIFSIYVISKAGEFISAMNQIAQSLEKVAITINQTAIISKPIEQPIRII